MRHVMWVTIAALALLGGAAAWADDPVAYLSEIHRTGKGEVRVKGPADGDWKAPQPLMPLHAGDQIRIAGEHSVVVLYRGASGAQRLAAANSPFVIPPSPPAAKMAQARQVAGAVKDFMSLRQPPPTYRKAATRAGGDPPTIVSPRQTRLLPGAPTFEWDGPAGLTYAVRVMGPDGVLWAEAKLSGRTVTYPASAPALRDGVRYTWELEPAGFPAQRASFELLSESDAANVRQALAALAQADYPRTTAALMRAAVFMDRQLFQEARRELDAAAATDRDEPTLQVALGHVYDKTGVATRALAAFERARVLGGEK